VSASITLSGSEATAPRVVIDGTGREVFSWTRFDTEQRLQARTRGTAGTFGPVLNLGVTSSASHSLAALGADAVLEAWTQPNENGHPIVVSKGP
jgi:hypothetical protein